VDDDGYHGNTEEDRDADAVVVEFEEGRGGGFRFGSTISFGINKTQGSSYNVDSDSV
jgi:hypothetical protein